MLEPVLFHGAVEGDLDEVVLQRIVAHTGARIARMFKAGGKAPLLQRISGYKNSAARHPWVVLVDMDRDDECAARLRRLWVGEPGSFMCFRIAVRSVEAWLLADRERMASFLKVSPTRIPTNPESLGDPKRYLVDLARNSRSPRIRKELVPREGSGRVEGPLYTPRLMEFVLNRDKGWRPDVAAESSDSLKRALRCLRRVIERYSGVA